ncbi:MAG TPA: GatB/YqeY domain-containing protein [Thermoanaerobaculia bacterium]|nr:GatB/YqeY domain-containing protein [Thermoanaerobaculia bacterium]
MTTIAPTAGSSTAAAPQQRIETELKAAMKSGDKQRLQTLRLLLTEIKNERIRRGSEVDEAGFVALVRKAKSSSARRRPCSTAPASARSSPPRRRARR